MASMCPELEVLTKAKEKLLIQQCLIDTTARTLQRLKESTSGLGANSAIDDDIKLQENKLMKGFANQLLEKHVCLEYLLEECRDFPVESLEQVRRELDNLISLKQFLSVTGLQAATVKVLLEEEHLTLDLLFSMLNSDLELLMTKYSIPVCECRKLLGALDHLTTYYEMWERGVKHSVASLNNYSDRDSRSSSISSSTSAGTSPLSIKRHTSVTPQSSSSPSAALADSTALFVPSSSSVVIPTLTAPQTSSRRKPSLTHKHTDSSSSASRESTDRKGKTSTQSNLVRYSYRSPSPPGLSHQSRFQPPVPQKQSRHPRQRSCSPTLRRSTSFKELLWSEAHPIKFLKRRKGDSSIVPQPSSMVDTLQMECLQSEDHNINPTSSSMVDLSNDECSDQEEDNYLTRSPKSQYVPRLTLMAVSHDNEKYGFTSNSHNPTSPLMPGSYMPNRSMRHTIMHRFVSKAFMTPHICDYCKMTVMIGVRCKDCKYSTERGWWSEFLGGVGYLPQDQRRLKEKLLW